MSQLLRKLQSARPCLIVSLPRNHPDMARAAESAGADALKVHMHVTHHATHITFGTLEEERAALERVLAAVKIPVGLVPGEDVGMPAETLRAISKMGFTFTDAYSHTLPAWLNDTGLDFWAAIGPTYTLSEVQAIASIPWVDVIEAAVIPTEAYGEFLSLRDLARYRQLAASLNKPFVVPSQRKLRVEDIPSLLTVGAKNLMIGAMVTGMEISGIEDATRAFRRAMDAR